jgi:phage terminase large subunit
MTQSVLVSWEEKTVGNDNPCIDGEASRATRKSYRYANGSEVIVGGLENEDSVMSQEYDVIVVHEATEVMDAGPYEKLLTRARNNVLPFQLVLLECNPGARNHWINQRFPVGSYGVNGGESVVEEDGVRSVMRRFMTRIEDNPSIKPEYVVKLRATLRGARRARLLENKWVSEEGQIYEEYDSLVHMVMPARVPRLRWTFGAVDWAARGINCMQVWGLGEDDCMYRVAEVYRSKVTLDQLATWAVELNEKWDMRAIVCDSAEPDKIDYFNDRLGHHMGRPMGRIARKANKSFQTGVDQVRWALGSRMLYLVKDAFPYGIDMDLREAGKPWCTEEEIEGYVWAKNVDGQAMKERAAAGCADHGLDAMRYAAMYAWERDSGQTMSGLKASVLAAGAKDGMLKTLGKKWFGRYAQPTEGEACGGLVVRGKLRA